MTEPIALPPSSPLVDPFVFAKHFTVDPSPPPKSSILDEATKFGETSEFTRAFRSSGVYLHSPPPPPPRSYRRKLREGPLSPLAASALADSEQEFDTDGSGTEPELESEETGGESEAELTFDLEPELDMFARSESDTSIATAQSSPRIADICALPDEVLVYVTRFLRLYDVMALIETSRHFKQLCSHREVWHNLYFFYDFQLGPMFEDGPDVNVWEEEPLAVIDVAPASPSMSNTVAHTEARERPSFSSNNSVSSFFHPPAGDESPRKTRTYSHFATISSSASKEAAPIHASSASSFLLPLSRLSMAPSLLSPTKKDPSHGAPSIRSKPPTPLHSPEVSRAAASTTTTFPPTKGKKHAWVFPKRTKGGPNNTTESDPASPSPFSSGGGMGEEEPVQASSCAVTLNNMIQSLTPASTVPSSLSVEKFLNTYFQTTTPATLIRKLIQRYNVPRNIAPELSDLEFHVKFERPIQLRVCRLLKAVVEDVHLEWSPLLVSLVKVFIYGFIDKQSDLTRMLSKSLLKRFPGGRPLMHFSRPILMCVLRNLDLSNLCRAAQVCKMWNDTSSQPDVWRNLFKYYESHTVLDPHEVPLWEALRQSPTFETDYSISSSDILTKSPSASPPLSRLANSELPLLTRQRFSSDFPTISVTPPQQPQPHPHPPPPQQHTEPEESSLPTEASPPPPSSLSDLPPSPSLPRAASSVTPSAAAASRTSPTPLQHSSSFPTLGTIDETAPCSPEDPPQIASGPPTTPSAVRASKVVRGHHRTGSDLNMKKISLNNLVESLTPVSTLPDLMDINAFLMTYRTFTTPQHLVRKLLQRYMVPRELFPKMSDAEFKVSIEYPIQLRVCKILKQLLDSHFSDLDNLTVTFLKVFVRGIVDPKSPLAPSLLRSLTKNGTKTPSFYVGTKEKTTKKFMLSRRLSEMPATIKRLPTAYAAPQNNFTHFEPLEIAQELCVIEYEIFSVLKPSEFFQQAWAKANAEKSAPNIRRSIGRFNEVTRWIVTLVLQQEKLSKRVKMMQRLIQIAKHLRDLNNFHTLMAFLAGLNDGPIFRLKFTLAAIPESKVKLLEELQSLMNADSNYENYRQLLAVIPSTQPCIPYLGVCLRDLTYYEEGSAGSPEAGMINFKQSKNVYSVLHYISVHQKIAYPFESNPILRGMLKDLPLIEDDDGIYRLSLLREPRNAKRADIL